MIKFWVEIFEKRSPIKSEFRVDNSRTLLFHKFPQVINSDEPSIIVIIIFGSCWIMTLKIYILSKQNVLELKEHLYLTVYGFWNKEFVFSIVTMPRNSKSTLSKTQFRHSPQLPLPITGFSHPAWHLSPDKLVLFSVR